MCWGYIKATTINNASLFQGDSKSQCLGPSPVSKGAWWSPCLLIWALLFSSVKWGEHRIDQHSSKRFMACQFQTLLGITQRGKWGMVLWSNKFDKQNIACFFASGLLQVFMGRTQWTMNLWIIGPWYPLGASCRLELEKYWVSWSLGFLLLPIYDPANFGETGYSVGGQRAWPLLPLPAQGQIWNVRSSLRH